MAGAPPTPRGCLENPRRCDLRVPGIYASGVAFGHFVLNGNGTLNGTTTLVNSGEGACRAALMTGATGWSWAELRPGGS
jgi:hypothetical protein